jgi:hypothetical protein
MAPLVDGSVLRAVPPCFRTAAVMIFAQSGIISQELRTWLLMGGQQCRDNQVESFVPDVAAPVDPASEPLARGRLFLPGDISRSLKVEWNVYRRPFDTVRNTLRYFVCIINETRLEVDITGSSADGICPNKTHFSPPCVLLCKVTRAGSDV